MPAPKPYRLESDRCWFEHDAGFLAAVGHSSSFSPWNSGLKRLHGNDAVRGWRSNEVTASMQVVEHVSAIEIDFDHGNPGAGLAGLLIHAGEVLWPGKTDPFRIRKRLVARGVVVGVVAS